MHTWARGISVLVMALALAGLLAAGCGGGGSAEGGRAAGQGGAGGRLVLVTQRGEGLPRLLGVDGEEVHLQSSSSTQSLNVILLSGEVVAASRSVIIDPQASTQQIVLEELPVGTFQLVIEFVDSSGHTFAFFSTQVTLLAGQVTRVTLSPSSSPGSGFFVYTANYDSGTISGFVMDFNGNLTPVPGSPFNAGGPGAGTEQLAVDPTSSLLFASTNNAVHSVRSFLINPATGALTPADSQILASQPIGLDTHPFSSIPRLYAATGGGQTVEVFTYDLAGALTQGSPLTDINGPVDVSVHPGGNFAFGSDFSNAIASYTVDSGGGLVAIVDTQAPNGAAVRGRIGIKGGRSFLYTSVQAQDQAFKTEIDIGGGGLLTSPQSMDLPSQPGAPFQPRGLDVDPLVNHLYQACLSNQILVFDLDANGNMAHSQTMAAPGTAGPDTVESVKVDPTGSFLVAAHHLNGGSSPGALLVYDILANGQISLVNSAAVGNGPSDVIFATP